MKNYLKTLLFFFVASVTLVSCGSDDDEPKVEANEFKLDGVTTAITKAPFWVAANPAHGINEDYIRFENPIAGGSTVNLFKITPISGSNPVEGIYTYSDSGKLNTYKIVHTHNQEGFSYDWTTNGTSGSVLEIELIKEGASTGNVYDIKISKFTLDYGNWDFATFTWISEGTKELVFHYRGVIDLP